MKRSLFSLASVVCLAACSPHKPPPPALPAPPPAATVTPPPPAPPPPAPSTTTTGVYLDPTIASACGIPQPKMFFTFDSAAVKRADADSATVDTLSQCLTGGALKGKSLEIVGRTDPRGTDDYNQKLGKSRAESVAEVLTAHGVGQGMIKTRSTGEEKATGNDENGWAFDRRVDIRLAK
jgi:peptidoglycan-associated lipoprotein